MYRHPHAKTLRNLAASTAAFESLMQCWKDMRDEENGKLVKMALLSLQDISVRETAQIYRGRVAMMDDIIAMFEQFSKTE